MSIHLMDAVAEPGPAGEPGDKRNGLCDPYSVDEYREILQVLEDERENIVNPVVPRETILRIHREMRRRKDWEEPQVRRVFQAVYA